MKVASSPWIRMMVCIWVLATSHSSCNGKPLSLPLCMIDTHQTSGIAFDLDPNIALFFDTQNPIYNLVFKNSNGSVTSRRYQAKIKTVGLKAECALHLNCMFVTSSQFCYENTNKVILLGKGIELSLPTIIAGLYVSYVPFLNAPGGMVTLRIALGPSIALGSFIYGGYLYPLTMHSSY